MKRKKYIVGNWKMFKTAETASHDFLILKNFLNSHFTTVLDIGICPPAVFLNGLSNYKDSIHIYAQNVYWQEEGAFTGEISVPMLKSLHVDGSLVAHSERRQYFHETNVEAGKKLHALLKNGLRAIYCIGESLKERESGKVSDVIELQLKEALSLCVEDIKIFESKHNPEIFSYLSIAYEPVWAIGTGKAATVQNAHDVHLFIRKILSEIFGSSMAQRIRILYGGSVKLTNVGEFLTDSEIDGALVGGASLDPHEFFNLCKAGVIP